MKTESAVELLIWIAYASPWICGWAVLANLESNRRSWTMISITVVAGILALEATTAFGSGESGRFDEFEWKVAASLPLAVEGLFYLLDEFRLREFGDDSIFGHTLILLMWAGVAGLIWAVWTSLDNPQYDLAELASAIFVIGIFEGARAGGALLALIAAVYRRASGA